MSRPKLLNKKPSKSVTLNSRTIQALTALGDGNLSAGIEIAFQGYTAFRALQGMGPMDTQEHNPITGPKKKKAKK
jgi:hypothetical protein